MLRVSGSVERIGILSASPRRLAQWATNISYMQMPIAHRRGIWGLPAKGETCHLLEFFGAQTLLDLDGFSMISHSAWKGMKICIDMYCKMLQN